MQSEDMRRIYVNVLTNLTGIDTRRYWENRILGIGSPKFDKVQQVIQQEQKLPETWRNIVEKPHGQRKKILFYNTSVSTLLEYREQMIDKMREVFKILKDHKDEIALLWRPHPLIQATIESMQPLLWESYRRLVEEYKEGGWGIYDDTADLERAIALSDAYYGDWSSVVQLCHKAGLPVMIQSITQDGGMQKNEKRRG